MVFRSMSVLAAAATLAGIVAAGGCTAQGRPRHAAGPCDRALALPSPGLVALGAVGDPAGGEFGRNDARLGRPGPAAGIILDVSVTETRQRLRISNGRPRDHTTWRQGSLRVRTGR